MTIKNAKRFYQTWPFLLEKLQFIIFNRILSGFQCVSIVKLYYLCDCFHVSS